MTTEARDKPIDLFLEWFEEAKSAELVLPEAMSVASVGADGRPSSRMVLLKDADPRGFVFYTNLNSRKGSEIQANDHVALLFHWKSLKRQIRIEGPAVPVSDGNPPLTSQPGAILPQRLHIRNQRRKPVLEVLSVGTGGKQW